MSTSSSSSSSILVLLLTISFQLAHSICKNPPIIFNFGDSNSDTGGLVAAIGFPLKLPYGRTFFRRSTGRFSDGRLIVDFLCQSVGTSLLSPYLESIGSNLIYNEGGRKFWVHNTGPLGCLPQKLSQLKNESNIDLDSVGCITSYNAAAKAFNEGLRRSCIKLRSEMKDASIVYVDLYAIKFDLIANPTNYGLSSPLMACCGSGGPPYNYESKVACTYPVCEDPTQSVSWDGIHYTEAANSIIASKILSTTHSTPRVSFDFFCR